MRNRRGPADDNQTAPCHSQMRHYSAEKGPTSPAAAAAGAYGPVRAWCRAASRRPPASRRTAPSARHRRSGATASERREGRPIPDVRNRDDPSREGLRGTLPAFRESRAIVRPRSQPELSVATVSPHGCSLAHSSRAMARNARRARRFEILRNVRFSDRHPLRSPPFAHPPIPSPRQEMGAKPRTDNPSRLWSA